MKFVMSQANLGVKRIENENVQTSSGKPCSGYKSYRCWSQEGKPSTTLPVRQEHDADS